MQSHVRQIIQSEHTHEGAGSQDTRIKQAERSNCPKATRGGEVPAVATIQAAVWQWDW